MAWAHVARSNVDQPTCREEVRIGTVVNPHTTKQEPTQGKARRQQQPTSHAHTHLCQPRSCGPWQLVFLTGLCLRAVLCHIELGMGVLEGRESWLGNRSGLLFEFLIIAKRQSPTTISRALLLTPRRGQRPLPRDEPTLSGPHTPLRGRVIVRLRWR